MNTNTPAVNHETNFNTREEYIQFVTNWKKTYKELSQRIRNTKVDHKTIQRLSLIVNPNEGQTQGVLAAKTRSFANTPNWEYFTLLKELKSQATAMLLQRAESKIRAAELRQERLEVIS